VYLEKEKALTKFMDQIVENVKAERKKRKVSQLKLAQILSHKSPNYVAKIETGKHDVHYNLEHLYKIASEFEIEVRDLIPNIQQ